MQTDEATYEKERQLVALFRQLNPDYQEIVIEFLQGLLTSKDARI